MRDNRPVFEWRFFCLRCHYDLCVTCGVANVEGQVVATCSRMIVCVRARIRTAIARWQQAARATVCVGTSRAH
jgi:transcription elongation factor Elf1